MARPRKTPIRPVAEQTSPLRPPMREMDSVARAAQRAQEILGDADSLDTGSDKYYIDPDIIPDGWDYQWRRKEVYGKEDPSYMVNLKRMGWEEVPAARHPEMMPGGYRGAIERDGLVLMERPMEITHRARASELREAQRLVRAKEEQLGHAPAGQFERDHQNVRPRIKKSYSPVEIPGDAA